MSLELSPRPSPRASEQGQSDIDRGLDDFDQVLPPSMLLSSSDSESGEGQSILYGFDGTKAYRIVDSITEYAEAMDPPEKGSGFPYVARFADGCTWDVAGCIYQAESEPEWQDVDGVSELAARQL